MRSLTWCSLPSGAMPNQIRSTNVAMGYRTTSFSGGEAIRWNDGSSAVAAASLRQNCIAVPRREHHAEHHCGAEHDGQRNRYTNNRCRREQP